MPGQMFLSTQFKKTENIRESMQKYPAAVAANFPLPAGPRYFFKPTSQNLAIRGIEVDDGHVPLSASLSNSRASLVFALSDGCLVHDDRVALPYATREDDLEPVACGLAKGANHVRLPFGIRDSQLIANQLG